MLRAGWEARVTIENTGSQQVYMNVKRFEIEAEAPGLDVSGTEGIPGKAGRPNSGLLANTGGTPGFASKVPNIKSARLTLRWPTYDDAANPFTTAPTLREGTYATNIRIYPNGSTNPHIFTGGLVVSVRHEGEVGSEQPLTIVIESDGQYTLV